jgi:FkbM family methyltransferase
MESPFGDIHQNVGIWLGRIAEYLENPHVYDIGAHTGLFTKMLAKQGCSVTAFEPVPSTLEALKEAIQNDGLTEKVTIVPHGLSDVETEKTLFQFSDETFNSLYPRGAEEMAQYGLSFLGGTKVSIKTLDSLQKEMELPLPGLIKIDIEGAELPAFRGGEKTITAARPIIVSEYSTGNCQNAGYERAELHTFLGEKDYQVFGLFRNEDEQLYGSERFDDPRIWNLIAVPKESMEAFSRKHAKYIAKK